MADQHTTPAAPADLAAAAKLDQAAGLFEEIATLASRTDRECFHLHGVILDDIPPELASRVFDELARLRDVITRIGWMADLGCGENVRGGAAVWLLPHSLQRPAPESDAG